MSRYQIFMLNRLGEVTYDSDAECESDEEARFAAELLLTPGAIAEVSIGARRIGIVNSDATATMH